MTEGEGEKRDRKAPESHVDALEEWISDLWTGYEEELRRSRDSWDREKPGVLRRAEKPGIKTGQTRDLGNRHTAIMPTRPTIAPRVKAVERSARSPSQPVSRVAKAVERKLKPMYRPLAVDRCSPATS